MSVRRESLAPPVTLNVMKSSPPQGHWLPRTGGKQPQDSPLLRWNLAPDPTFLADRDDSDTLTL